MGLCEQLIPVPDLYGLTLAEAKAELGAKGITLAALLASGTITDTLNSFVYKQNPDMKNDEGQTIFIQPGQTMDVWISSTRPAPDSSKINNIPPDSIKNNKP